MSEARSPYTRVVQMDIEPEREALFQSVYNSEHVLALLEVDGVRSIHRYRRADDLKISLGGEVRNLVFPAEPRFTAIYEIDTPHVLLTQAWANAVEFGQWSTAVRLYTSNRRHTLQQLILAGHARRYTGS